MRAACVFFAVAAVVAAAPGKPELEQIRNVVLFPMGSGLDHYLANRLTETGRFVVVTDPEAADAILTERLGEAFRMRYDEIYKREPEKDTDDEGETAEKIIRRSEQEERRLRSGTFGRSRGTMFLVDRRTGAVIWSHYRRPRNTQPDELDRLAEYLANRLRKDAGKTMPAAQPSVVAAPAAAPTTTAPAPPASPAPAPDTAVPVEP